MARGSDDPRDSSESTSEIDSDRRKLLAALGTGAAAGLAGCPGSGSGDTETPTEEDTTSGGDTESDTETSSGGMTSRVYTSYGNSEIPKQTWNVYEHRTTMPVHVSRFVFGFKASYDQDTGDVMPMLVEHQSTSDSEIKFKVKESGWSDGDPLTAKDWGIPYQISRWSGPNPEELKNGDGPANAWEAITDITWDGQDITFHSEPGWFGDFFIEQFVTDLQTHPNNQNLGETFATKVSKYIEPKYNEFKDMSWSERQDAITSWSENETSNWEADDPTEIPTSGPFTIDKVNESSVELVKNEHYYKADEINYEGVEVQMILEPRKVNLALKNNKLDGINGQLHKPKANVMESFPDNLKHYLHDASKTSGLTLNSSANKWFGKPRVRQAIYLALDKPQLAKQGHKIADQPPQNPPGLNAAPFQKYVPDDVKSKFEMYEKDLEKANQLMKDAGFTKENGIWQTPDGEPFSATLLTTANDVSVPSLVISQLGEFGMELDLTTQSSTVVTNRKEEGDWEMAMQGWWVDHLGLWTRAVQQSVRRHRFGIWSDQKVEDFVAKYEDQGVENVKYDWTYNLEGWESNKEWMKTFSVPTPPVGKPNSDETVQIPAPYWAWRWGEALSEKERQKAATQTAWAFNQYLPYLPFGVSSQIAFQDHDEWNAPTDEKTWRQHAPIHKLVQQAEITAKPE